MHIYWHGTTTVKIQAKIMGEDITVVVDPYTNPNGLHQRSYTTDIALYTRSEKNSITLVGNPFTTTSPGEYDVKGVLITGIRSEKPKNTHYRLDAEHMSVAHLALTNKLLTDREVDELSNIDILIIPVCHPDGYTPEQAVKVINEIEPRLLIPIAYNSTFDTDAAPLDAFIKEIGITPAQTDKKAIIKKKTLPQDEMQMYICEAA